MWRFWYVLGSTGNAHVGASLRPASARGAFCLVGSLGVGRSVHGYAPFRFAWSRQLDAFAHRSYSTLPLRA